MGDMDIPLYPAETLWSDFSDEFALTAPASTSEFMSSRPGAAQAAPAPARLLVRARGSSRHRCAQAAVPPPPASLSGGYAAAFMGGNVGIGTASPSGAFTVKAPGSGTYVNTNMIGLNSSSTEMFAMNAESSGYSLYDKNTGSWVLGLRQVAGNVGIGNTSPSYTLQVNGSVAGTSAYVNTSDLRHKKNIQPLDAGLNEVEQLRPVTFEWKDDMLNQSIDGKVIHCPLEPFMQGKQIGLIAQDVEKILPSVVVTEANAEKTKGMNMPNLSPC
jgi:hypothetical protein